jgi:hypothetical protein
MSRDDASLLDIARAAQLILGFAEGLEKSELVAKPSNDYLLTSAIGTQIFLGEKLPECETS